MMLARRAGGVAMIRRTVLVRTTRRLCGAGARSTTLVPPPAQARRCTTVPWSGPPPRQWQARPGRSRRPPVSAWIFSGSCQFLAVRKDPGRLGGEVACRVKGPIGHQVIWSCLLFVASTVNVLTTVIDCQLILYGMLYVCSLAPCGCCGVSRRRCSISCCRGSANLPAWRAA